MAIQNRAVEWYNQGQTVGTVAGTPRHKFQFEASMNVINSTGGGTKTVPLRRIQSVTMPSWNSNATTLNSYNAKKIIQTGYDYTPITVIAYDTREPQNDNTAIESFLQEYSAHYFAGPMNLENRSALSPSVPKGFILRSKEDRNFIKTLTIVRTIQNDINEIVIYNPIIQDIQTDTLDYSDSGLVTYRLTFIYEGYSVNTKSN